MKKQLLALAAFAAATTMSADEWVKPVYAGAFQPLTTDAIVYIYNTESQMFLTEGNDWGTHATVADTGLQFKISKYQEENSDGTLKDWDGVTYTIADSSVVKGEWKNLFITDGGQVYVDRGSQEDYFFSFEDKGNNTYSIYGADINPTWNAIGDNAGYLLGHNINYNNSRDGEVTGTGVIYDYYGMDHSYAEGEFRTTWAFVSVSDYDAYQAKVITYAAAVALKSLIDEAAAMGVDTADAAAVYANTSATKEELDAAREALYKKVLKHYEEVVTPDSPMQIFYDPCDNIDNWSNAILATTWNTQNWIDETWQGFEGTTLNIWGNPLNGSAFKELADLPNGIYVVSMAAYSEKMDGAVYANINTVSVPAGAAGNIYKVTTNVTDGNLDFGFAQTERGTNWVAIDNVKVEYYGSGVEAYRYWLQSLKESMPSLDDVVVQTSLIEEYNAFMDEVDKAKTNEDILAIIPKYEDILNRVLVNASAYETLFDKVLKADKMTIDPLINVHYSDLIADAVLSYMGVLEEHTLGTAEVLAKIDELDSLVDEAQNYIWKIETYDSELLKLADIYSEHSGTCSLDALNAYDAFMEKVEAFDRSKATAKDVQALLDEMYEVEFALQIPADPASDDNPVDYTSKIVNPSFDGVEGWTNDGWATFSNNTWYGFANEEGASSGDGNYLNLWNEGNATASQTLTGLPAGAYTVQCGAYADNEGFELFANDNTVAVEVGKNEMDQYMRIYTIDVILAEGEDLVIGARNTNGGTQWAMVDEYHLTYFGTESHIITGISGTTASANASAVYTLSGARTNLMQRGINIVRMSDGTVRKVMLK